jgi:hypothetical protein
MSACCRIARLSPIGLVLGLVLWLMAGCGGSGGEYGGSPQQEQKAAPPVTGSFVGEALDADAFVAIVAASPEEEGQERDVRAYLCDGKRVTEWFTGMAEGNELDLSSEGGARLEGNLTPETSTGTITLDGGESFTFTADLARGVAGLYNVTVSEEGQLRGISETGGQLEGQIADEPQDGDGYLARGTITSPEGQSEDFVGVTLDELPAGEEFRYIVSENGEVKGARKRATTASGFLMPIECNV